MHPFVTQKAYNEQEKIC